MSSAQCPNCSQSGLTVEAPGVLVCGNCHARIIGGQLACPSCQALNPVGKDTCSVCGEALTIVGRVMARQGSQIKSQRLDQARSRANLIKDVERVSSDKRMAGFVEIDRRRIEYEREAQKLQESKDRQLFRGLAIGLGIFLLLIAVVTLVIIL